MSFLLVLSLVVPIAGALLAFVVGGRWVVRIALATMPLGLAIAVAIAAELRPAGGSLVYLLGGWSPPLGVALRADWLSAVMMVTTAVVISAIGLFARADFAGGPVETRRSFAFWILLLAVWGALNTVFLSGDLFTFYVSLELLVFVAVPLVALDGRAETLQAALRYLLFALLGSVLYLAGTGLLYGAYGTLDIGVLSGRIRAEPVTAVAVTLMTVGLMAKTALFPLYLWLPAAHAGAPAAASAVLSALVVKGSFFIIVRLWFFVMPGLAGVAAPQLLRRPGRRRDRLRQPAGVATGEAQAAGRLLDRGAARLSLPGVSPRPRRRSGTAHRWQRPDRRPHTGGLSRHRQGRHVHGGGHDLRGAGP